MSRLPLCVIGEAPHPEIRRVLESFQLLARTAFGTSAGRVVSDGARTPGDCGGLRRYLRLYSGPAPVDLLAADLRALDTTFRLGLPRSPDTRVVSPGQAVTYFAPDGPVNHIFVRQPAADRSPSDLELRFFRSILIEELYQSLTFGMDVIHFDRDEPFLSKLEEAPQRRILGDWGSEEFMEDLLSASPEGLCGFDVFMLHALARSGLRATNDPALLSFIEAEFDGLVLLAQETLAAQPFRVLVDPTCAAAPG